jgi:hypothetical protein
MQDVLRRTIYSIAIGMAFFSAKPASAAEVLITEQEAKLPPARDAKPDSRGITRGPRISLVTEPEVHSPMHLQLAFQFFGGAKIDPQSLRVVLLKTPEVDLTSRVKPFIQANGIDMPDAETPTGAYDVRIELKDSEGRPAARIFSFKVIE